MQSGDSDLPDDPPAPGIHRRQLHAHPITDQHPHEIPIDAIRHVRQDLRSVVEPHAIHRARQLLDDHAPQASGRPYRRALPTLHALAEIERCAGTQFDPNIAHAFLRAWSAGGFADAAAM